YPHQSPDVILFESAPFSCLYLSIVLLLQVSNKLTPCLEVFPKVVQVLSGFLNCFEHLCVEKDTGGGNLSRIAIVRHLLWQIIDIYTPPSRGVTKAGIPKPWVLRLFGIILLSTEPTHQMHLTSSVIFVVFLSVIPTS